LLFELGAGEVAALFVMRNSIVSGPVHKEDETPDRVFHGVHS